MKDFEPQAIAFEEDENGFGVQIEDKLGNHPTVWIDVYDFKEDDYPTVDWNMWVFHKYNSYEQAVKQFQADAMENDGWMWCLLEECAVDYLCAKGRIEATGYGYRRLD